MSAVNTVEPVYRTLTATVVGSVDEIRRDKIYFRLRPSALEPKALSFRVGCRVGFSYRGRLRPRGSSELFPVVVAIGDGWFTFSSPHDPSFHTHAFDAWAGFPTLTEGDDICLIEPATEADR